MSEGYPLLTLPANETYQLAHIATYIASALARRRAATGSSRSAFRARARAVRDLAGGREALVRLTGATDGSGRLAASQLPQPMDVATFNTARGLLRGGQRWAEVVSLAPAGGAGWAVLGHVPGLGPVGARVPTPELAEALRQHVLTRPAGELAPWAVTDRAHRMPVVPRQVDLPDFVTGLDPGSVDARAVAAALRGADRQTDAAISTRFAGIDLDVPPVLRPPEPGTPQPATEPPAEPGSAPEPNPAAGSDAAPGRGAGPQATGAGDAGAGGGAAPGPVAGTGSDPVADPVRGPGPVAGAGGQAAAATPQSEPAPARARRVLPARGSSGRGRRPATGRAAAPSADSGAGGDPSAAAGPGSGSAGAQPPPDPQPAGSGRAGTAAARRAAAVNSATRTTYRRSAVPARQTGQGPGTSAAAAPPSSAGP